LQVRDLPPLPAERSRLRRLPQAFSEWSVDSVAFDPLKFAREVRSEVAKVTWPSRRETLVTTGLVFLMVAIAAIFFFTVDQVIGVAVRMLFGVSGS
jgi:preprotein translocase subunit SecE